MQIKNPHKSVILLCGRSFVSSGQNRCRVITLMRYGFGVLLIRNRLYPNEITINVIATEIR